MKINCDADNTNIPADSQLAVNYHNHDLKIACNLGCLRIDSALFACPDRDDQEIDDQDTAYAQHICGDGAHGGTTNKCTLRACPSFWNKPNMNCTNPMQAVKFRFK